MTKNDIDSKYDKKVQYFIFEFMFIFPEDEPFPTPPANDTDGQRFYLKRMIQWAEQSGIKVRFGFT